MWYLLAKTSKNEKTQKIGIKLHKDVDLETPDKLWCLGNRALKPNPYSKKVADNVFILTSPKTPPQLSIPHVVLDSIWKIDNYSPEL